MPDAVIVSAVRTPVGRARKGALAAVRPDDLATTAVRAALAAVPQLDPGEVDDLHLGCAEPSGEAGSNLARVVAVLAGLDGVPGVTVNRFCASSVQTTRMALHAIRAGEGTAFVSAGVESVSRYPAFAGAGQSEDRYLNPAFDAARRRTAERARPGAGVWSDPRADGALPDVYLAMGQTAENVAGLRGVGREEQDAWALTSQQRAARAAAAGLFASELVPVPLPGGGVLEADESPRPATTAEGLAALAPVFREDGTVTAGNCCPLNDGAAALVVMADARARELGITPLARIVSTGVSALSPEVMGLGPVEASRRALARAGMAVGDVDLVEVNEAFAAQVLPSAADLGVDLERLNVHGGAIALGHPFGMSGARITTTLLTALRARDATTGLVTLCVGGGQGMAMVLERLS
jgi:acetyl-CoA C-acetyltransferase